MATSKFETTDNKITLLCKEDKKDGARERPIYVLLTYDAASSLSGTAPSEVSETAWEESSGSSSSSSVTKNREHPVLVLYYQS